MTYDFFRKERENIFNQRFNIPTSINNYYVLKSNTVFQAKKYNGTKTFTVTVNNQKQKLIASVVNNNSLGVKSDPTVTSNRINVIITESDMANIFKSTSVSNRNKSMNYQIAKRLCQDHATSSASSLLISGCIVNNFAQSVAYPGCKLSLKLKSRQPFENPFASGNEKEYFLIGRVLDTDCQVIQYLGKTNESLNELVNPFGCKIPRPKSSFNKKIDFSGSKIPRPA